MISLHQCKETKIKQINSKIDSNIINTEFCLLGLSLIKIVSDFLGFGNEHGSGKACFHKNAAFARFGVAGVTNPSGFGGGT